MADANADGCYSLKYHTCLTTPYSRVVALAANARQLNNTATEADVTPEIIAPGELHIHVFDDIWRPRCRMSGVAARAPFSLFVERLWMTVFSRTLKWAAGASLRCREMRGAAERGEELKRQQRRFGRRTGEEAWAFG